MFRLITFGYVLLAVIVIGAGCETKTDQTTAPPQPDAAVFATSSGSVVIKETPYDADAFLDPKALALIRRSESRQLSAVSCKLGTIRAGIVNHHTLAADLQWDFFATLAHCRPKVDRLIIVSPDHFRASSAIFTTTRRAYQSRGIVVSSDNGGIDRLMQSVPSSLVSDEPFIREHGIGALVPFLVATQNENASSSRIRILPIIVNPTITKEEAIAFAGWLKNEMTGGTFVVISSDMSHYLAKDAALANDQTTERALVQSDQTFFWRATDDFTDSGRSIWMLIQAAGKTTWRETAHKISTDYGTSPQSTTSYLTGFWE